MEEIELLCLQEEVKKYLHKCHIQGVYSAASLAVFSCRDNTFTDSFISVGTSGKNDAHEVDKATVFDLASLTKPLVTLPSVLHLIDQGKISWNEPLDSLLETSLDKRFARVDLHSLLCHSSGFTAHRNFWKKLTSMKEEQKSQWLLDNILGEGLEYTTGARHLYSDVGYILLGYVVQKKTGLGLDSYWRDHIAEPAGVGEMLCFPTQNENKNYKRWVQTGHCRWTRRPLLGLVHDDNCRALGGVAGHAGLFGTSEGVLNLCKEYLNIYHHRKSKLPISTETFVKASTQVGESEWSCGFNLPSPSGSSSGSYFSKNSLGHLGFTGVSFWIDVEKQVAVSLLTNRVRQGDDTRAIKEVRPTLHDLVVCCLEEKNPPAEPGDC